MENGIEHYSSFPDSINKKKFKIFLEEMREKWPEDHVLLVADNLAVHRSREVKNKLEMLGMKMVFTPV